MRACVRACVRVRVRVWVYVRACARRARLEDVGQPAGLGREGYQQLRLHRPMDSHLCV
jgi:hypothetical protein